MAPVLQSDACSGQYHQVVNSINSDYITISEYILLRIYQLGIRSIFGVPGDFNLNFLEHLYDIDGLEWIGCCNELNAAYACDGYAKTCEKMAVLVSTFGVGELSALAGVAGMYSEYSPLLHLVGTSAMRLKNTDKKFHHLLSGSKTYEAPDHYLYEKVAANFSCAQGSIDLDADKACSTVDRVLREIHRCLRPGYLFLPCDLTEMKVPTSRLYEPLIVDYVPQISSRSTAVVEAILQKIYSSQNPALLVDYFISRCKMTNTLAKLLSKLDGRVNVYDTFMGKGLVDESHAWFVGTYQGALGNGDVARAIEETDLVLRIGTFDVEMNNGAFSAKLQDTNVVSLSIDSVSICGELVTDVNMRDVFEMLVEQLDVERVARSRKYEISRPSRPTGNEPLTMNDLRTHIEQSLTPNDVLIVDTGSFMWATGTIELHGAKFINQFLWAAIGYAIPATLGACIAKRDSGSPGRVITVEGDGAAEMTLQEIASLVRYKVDPVLYLLNNDGYTIERVIQGPNRSYNDIATKWQWTEMVRCFGGGKIGQKIASRSDLSQLSIGAGLQLLELLLPKFDVPEELTDLLARGKS
ncbi:hypothetical protein KL918_003696 [Ogataea parapolymorpha]|uniref:Phenylpyruvate decarboxylase, catalyzes decarboxylation of phenylpyruvate to phenylacetaldehyde n=1 Tax=Ogataea parapolymorpha (strain ATCC 26012 / BCRC 20466 / JCM 22074 / NRRL Y-7560 / DL-1) TaxID=871575 RepID=W1QJY7_OGAPD|nr:Phenylpyruvate decarboxylase, catalyzes decarboxylation of phenylpyruvate to phenylacetaldehyde [Ogataea parapolymorpha DL-1]ESX02152.1 Phenylpyruvate decarboxylase, catalyzes decarboxylation of phenylpyruvate to phenylacetaldehyde [Ogataea parapolymorpha DL-1]KAG7866231.1 hypothetical protein KL918_003696 [Ogataea parapolymorpha]KAG7871364.1 hypothetical protein KL916_004159 [Ogataea parapolymorpha]